MDFASMHAVWALYFFKVYGNIVTVIPRIYGVTCFSLIRLGAYLDSLPSAPRFLKNQLIIIKPPYGYLHLHFHCDKIIV